MPTAAPFLPPPSGYVPSSGALPAGPAVNSLAADGIPTVALDAYRRAAAESVTRYPACGLPWPLLAAIGRVESDHGRFANSQMYANGTTAPRIVGIPLNGVGTALIRDTDGGRLDGDKVYDRAVGPMQFIPSTWAHWGVDGNGDGVIDPSNIYDAATAAANYLCAAGGNLQTAAGQIRAVLTYNDSDAYLSTVLALEKVYAPVLRGQRAGHRAAPHAGAGREADAAAGRPGTAACGDASDILTRQRPCQAVRGSPDDTLGAADLRPRVLAVRRRVAGRRRRTPTCTTPPPSSTPGTPSTSAGTPASAAADSASASAASAASAAGSTSGSSAGTAASGQSPADGGTSGSTTPPPTCPPTT